MNPIPAPTGRPVFDPAAQASPEPRFRRTGGILPAGCPALIAIIATLVTPAGLLVASPVVKPDPQAGAVACRLQLNRIHETLQDYQATHGDLPAELSDLHPEFVAEPRLFTCPEVMQTGDFRSWRSGLRSDVFEDVLPRSYSYEFCLKEYPLWAGLASTEREYKMRQMRVIGSNVPVVRCLFHHLNLSLAGEIYPSRGRDGSWEERFTNQVALEKLLPIALFADFAPVPGRPHPAIPPRPPGTDPRQLDLGPYYVTALQIPWLWRNPRGADLAGLPLGDVQLDRVPVRFDIRGLIQLHTRSMIAPFPTRIDGILVGRTCRRLHLLEGAVDRTGREVAGKEIGHYSIRYADGSSARIPIRYGQDVVSAWGDASGPAPERVAWERQTRPGKSSPPRARVFHRAWDNPKPGTLITAIEFVSAGAMAAPFLVAITLEP